MKRFLCPKHSHHLKVQGKPVLLSSIVDCSICRWKQRIWTLVDFAQELENIASSMRLAHDNPGYDPMGITYGYDFQDLVKVWIKTIHPDYKESFLKAMNDETK